MAVLDIFRVNKIKADLEQAQKERDQMKSTLAETEHMDHYEMKRAIAELQEQKLQLEREVQNLGSAYTQTQRDLERKIADLKEQVEARKRSSSYLTMKCFFSHSAFIRPDTNYRTQMHIGQSLSRSENSRKQ